MANISLFRRSLSASSTQSNTLTHDTTPRTSIDSNSSNTTSESHMDAMKKQVAPLLSLPVELVQQITSYLDAGSAASFCLSSRFIYYALGSDRLTHYIKASKSRFVKRRAIEAIVERAFPGHWFCAWCDIFHAWDADATGPKNTIIPGRKRDCADFNSYLHAEGHYVLRFHHVRLAMNRAVWGQPEHGIPVSAFSHSQAGIAKIYRTPVPTKLEISAKIVDECFILHTSFTLILPHLATSRKHILDQIWPTIPHIVCGHRDSEHGHTGMMAAVDNVVRRGWKYPFTQICTTCATDWSVSCHTFPHATGGQTQLCVQTWRDLGNGRSPFDSAWRAHGVAAPGLDKNTGGDILRVSGLQAGDIRRAFDTDASNHKACVKERAASPVRARIYQAFMKREGDGGAADVRRSRARPRPNTWRTRSENEDAFKLHEEGRIELAIQVAESLVRLNAERRFGR
ncbi:hypothetical protein GQ44DRAFT_740041 [Phaeosphaeriaceae sp. PMI808]|nr:hypothetical protein GQ44DRAFT_740041 [Phaeosphaeriaceae sp. PMI808]